MSFIDLIGIVALFGFACLFLVLALAMVFGSGNDD